MEYYGAQGFDLRALDNREGADGSQRRLHRHHHRCPRHVSLLLRAPYHGRSDHSCCLVLRDPARGGRLRPAGVVRLHEAAGHIEHAVCHGHWRPDQHPQQHCRAGVWGRWRRQQQRRGGHEHARRPRRHESHLGRHVAAVSCKHLALRQHGRCRPRAARDGAQQGKAAELRKTAVQFAAILPGAGIMLFISWHRADVTASMAGDALESGDDVSGGRTVLPSSNVPTI